MKPDFRKITAAFLAVFTAAIATVPAFAAENNELPFIPAYTRIGDIRCDGRVDAVDRIYLTRYLAKWAGYDKINEEAADVNRDGKINTKDRIVLARHLANWEGYKTLPVNN